MKKCRRSFSQFENDGPDVCDPCRVLTLLFIFGSKGQVYGTERIYFPSRNSCLRLGLMEHYFSSEIRIFCNVLGFGSNRERMDGHFRG